MEITEILSNMDKIYRKLDDVIAKNTELNERLEKLEKKPQARKCELCGKTTLEEFVRHSWQNGKEYEICPECAKVEYAFEEKMRKDTEWRKQSKLRSTLATNDMGIRKSENPHERG